MSNILIINGSKAFGSSAGRLNDYLSGVARDALALMEHAIRISRIDNGYKNESEVEKILWADSIIYQFPVWWMGPPWHLKKYMDDVFTAGHEKLFRDDGRTRSDSSRKYGSGGLLQGKTYMLSMTWNAPLEAFTEPDQFFEGRGVDAVGFPLHKANQFLGLSSLPTFMFNDVVKEPTIESDVKRYQAHLKTLFG